MELLTKLGIDYRLLVAQFINFLILFLILYHFAYKPILKIMHDRQRKVIRSLKKAQKINEEWKKFKIKKEKSLQSLREQEMKILSKATKQADRLQSEKMLETEQKVKSLVQKAKEDLQRDKEKMVTEAKGEIKDMAKALALRVLEVNMTSARRQQLVKDTFESSK